MACNSGFTAGSSPPGTTGKATLQGFVGVIVFTRNEGVRGSNPRVGLAGSAGILLCWQQPRSLRGYETGTSLDTFSRGDVASVAAGFVPICR